MKKFFALMFASMILMTGCGNDSSKTEPSPKPVEQSAPAPKELTPEEQAAKEKEQKEAEEKRLAEEKAMAEKKAQEEARKKAELEAKQREQALAKTLQVMPEEFDQRLLDKINVISSSLGVETTDTLGEPEIKDNDKTETLIYVFDTDLVMHEIIDKSTGKIKEVNLLVSDLSKEMILLTLMYYEGMIQAVSPELSSEEINKIDVELGMDANLVENLDKDKSTIYKGKRYSKSVIRGKGLKFRIYVP